MKKIAAFFTALIMAGITILGMHEMCIRDSFQTVYGLVDRINRIRPLWRKYFKGQDGFILEKFGCLHSIDSFHLCWDI